MESDKGTEAHVRGGPVDLVRGPSLGVEFRCFILPYRFLRCLDIRVANSSEPGPLPSRVRASDLCRPRRTGRRAQFPQVTGFASG